nr:hypothetical protein CFP56_78201 [Quercus suber]
METDSDESLESDVMRADLYAGQEEWIFADTAKTEHVEEQAVTTRKIRDLYDSSQPFLTRAALQSLHDQLKNTLQPGEKVHVRGLDGTLVEFEIETGRTFPTARHDLEQVLDVESHFICVLDAWRKSQACARLKSIIDGSARRQCNKLVSFALGSVSRGFQESYPQRSAFQHALVLSLRETLCSDGTANAGIPCFAQDPDYTTVDKTLLSNFNVDVVDDPEGFLHLDEASAVVSCSPNVAVREIVSELARPAVIIWDTVQDDRDHIPLTDPVSPRIRGMLRADYDCVDFPGERTYFGQLSIYIRRK